MKKIAVSVAVGFVVVMVALIVFAGAVKVFGLSGCQTEKIVGPGGRVAFIDHGALLGRFSSARDGGPIYGGDQVWCDGDETAPGGDMAFVRIQSTGQSNQSVYVSHFTNNGWTAPCDTDAGLQQQ